MKNRSGVSSVQILLIAAVVIAGAYALKSYLKKQAVQETSVASGAKVIISLMGAPGAGKGTLAERAEKELGCLVLSTGNLVREEIAKDSEIGKKFKQFNDEGKLVPDDMIFELVKDWILKHSADGKAIILDGFPRTAIQAALLTDFVKTELKDFKFRVVELQISDEEVIKRIANRLVCEKCQAVYSVSQFEKPEEAKCEKCEGKLIRRADDQPEVVRARLAEYAQKNKPLIEFYHAMGIEIESIAADKPSDEVFAGFKAIVAK